jgi:hypothetical protein
MTKRRTEITVETERLLVAHTRLTTRVCCVRCGQEVWTPAGAEGKFEEEFSGGAAPNARPPRQPREAAARGERDRAGK